MRTTEPSGHRPVRRALVLGCGGTVGGAWTVGAVYALAQALDWDPRTAEVLVGTSSGSSLAAMLGAGFGTGELLAAQRGELGACAALRDFFTRPPAVLPRLPWPALTSKALVGRGLRTRQTLVAAAGLAPIGRSDASFLTELAATLTRRSGWVEHPATWLVGVDLTTACRVPFGADVAPRLPLDTALRASWAVPGWFAPVRVGDHQYADGGILSPTSADLLIGQDVDEVIVVAPMASTDHTCAPGLGARAERLLRTPMSRIVDAEVDQMRASGMRVLRVHPSATDLAVMGPHFMDPRRRLAALDAGLAAVAA